MNSRTCLTGILTLLVCLTACDLSGQERERGRDGGGRRGFGGGGFGMGRGTQTLFSLAGNPAVQKDLGVNEDQTKQLTKVNEDYFNEIRSAFSFDREAIEDATPEERAKIMADAQVKITAANKAATEKLKPELAKALDEKQMARLQQIYVQSLRGEAVENEEVASKLKLTDDQKDQIKKTKKEYEEKLAGLRNEEGDPMDRFAKMREIGTKRDEALLALLTPDQKTELDKLKGAEFDLTQLGGRRGGGGGGFGRGGEGGGRPNESGRPQRKAESDK